ncbi:hypothetical protein [Spongiivirga citrea]|uniref:Uncharacterized protein n=1 Tax=Spongiivirga citrea TaxID=1481457 RepID=A0A6M0CDK0_9FLAO|nr:hypothetical protein [Spongiivirga citrea]NER15898.1 hypothetical protein [Spongiivirga citrea]
MKKKDDDILKKAFNGRLIKTPKFITPKTKTEFKKETKPKEKRSSNK